MATETTTINTGEPALARQPTTKVTKANIYSGAGGEGEEENFVGYGDLTEEDKEALRMYS